MFPRHEAVCDPSGRADAADCCRGAPIEVRTSRPGQECQPTLLTRRAPPGDPPGGDRLTRWQMSLYSLCSSHRSPQGSTQADDGLEPAAIYAYAIRSGQLAKRGEGMKPSFKRRMQKFAPSKALMEQLKHYYMPANTPTR